MADDAPVAHIVHPADKIFQVFDGKRARVKSLCGAMVNGASNPDAPICRKCFNKYDKLDLVGGEAAGQKKSAASNP